MIKDITEEGKVSLLCLITKCDCGKTTKNTPYLSLTLEDKTGQLDAKYWNLTEEQVAQYKVGMIVEASGDIILHRNAAQLRVRKLVEKPDENLLDYVRQAPMSKEEMVHEIEQLIQGIKNDTIREIVQEIFKMEEDKFYIFPAATKNHHNFVGGLAYHTISMAKMGLSVIKMYPWLDADLLIAGILLHDIGKVEELSSAILPEYTNKGNLLGHISIMNNKIDRVAVALGKEECESVILLKHLVLSHHGKMEFGSPVLPLIPEAEVLTILDNLDSRMYMMKQSIEATQPGHFGPRVYALDGRMIYHKLEEQE